MVKMSVDQKFAKAMLNLRSLRPFYSAVYEIIEKRESDIVPTIGVGTNDMAYNYKFVDNTAFDELMFILLHEIGHIALMHVARRENRDAKLWNIACDLYVNKVLADEFDIVPGKCKTVNGITVSMPFGSLYCDSLDVNEDYTESIYEILESQAKSNGYFSNSGKSEYEFVYVGSKPHKSTVLNNSTGDVFKIRVNKDNAPSDLIDNGDDINVKQQKAEKIVSDAVVRVEMSSSSCGDTPGGLQALARKRLESHLDWRKLLRKYLISATTSDSSFSKPDKRMYYQRAIYPGQVSDEVNMVKGVKVCIDTSGSISDEDIEYFCGQVYDLTKQFKIDAELIYWDAEVQSTGKFTGYKEFERVDIYGRGGTDPSVVFNYFDSKKCKIKPIVTLMFTDAYFSVDGITPRQRHKYKDTIWIMTRHHDKDFKPPFGRKAIATFKE